VRIIASAMTKKNGKQKGKSTSIVPSDAVIYHGPIRNVATDIPNDAIIIRMSIAYSSITGGSTGLVVSLNNTQVSTLSEWASYAALYEEYRVLGFEMDYLPNYPGGNSAVVHGSGVRFTTHSSDTFVTPSLATCVQHANWKPFYSGVQFKEEWKMASIEEAGFYNTSNPSTLLLGECFAIAPTCSSTSAYGQIIGTFVVQFRGRK